MHLQGLRGGRRIWGVGFILRRSSLVHSGVRLPCLLASLEDEVSHLPAKANPVTCAGSQFSPFPRNSRLFYSVLMTSVSPSSVALSSYHIIMPTRTLQCEQTKTLPQSHLAFQAPCQGSHFPHKLPNKSLRAQNVRLLRSIHRQVLPLKLIYIHKVQQAHFGPHWVECSSVPADTDTSPSPLSSSFGTCHLSISRCTYL